MVGISLYTFGLSMALYFYERPGAHTVCVRIFEYKWLFVITYITFAMLAVSMSSLSRFQKHNNASLYHVIGFLPIHLTEAIPLVTHLLVCLCTDNDCVSETILFHCLAFVSLFAAIIFFVTKIPEKRNPGRYDYYFQSHQLFHMLVVVKTTLVYYYIPIDASLEELILSGVIAVCLV